jgi:hypothetical protein
MNIIPCTTQSDVYYPIFGGLDLENKVISVRSTPVIAWVIDRCDGKNFATPITCVGECRDFYLVKHKDDWDFYAPKFIREVGWFGDSLSEQISEIYQSESNESEFWSLLEQTFQGWQDNIDAAKNHDC